MKKLIFFLLSTLLLTLIFGIVIISTVEIFREEMREIHTDKLAKQDYHPKKDLTLRHGELEDNWFISSPIANLVDDLLYRGEKYSVRKPATFFLTRSLSVYVYPLFAAGDCVYNTGKGILGIPNSERSFEKAKSAAIGLLFSPAGMIYPDLVTHHFVSKRKTPFEIVPYGKLYSSYALELFPETPEEVKEIMLKAKESGRQVTFAGALMSQGKQALPASDRSILINFSRMNSVEIKGTKARVGAGATWNDVQREANKHKLAVHVMQASNIFSIGGSLAINCHGWDHQSGALSETVESILLVRPDGEIVRVNYGDELFHLAIGGLGGFGAIVEADIRLAPNQKLHYFGEEVAPDHYLNYFRDRIQNDEDMALHYYRLSLEPDSYFRTGIAANYAAMGPEGVVSDLEEEHLKGDRKERIKIQLLRRLRGTHQTAWEIEKSEALKSFETTRNEAMRPPINLIFNNSRRDVEWLQEYFVKGEQLENFLEFIGNVLKNNRVPVYNASVRYVKNNSSTLSYAKDGEMFAVVLFFNQSMLPENIEQTRRWVRQVTDYLNAHEGTYYLPYHHFASREQFRKSYPEWETVLRKKEQYDPEQLIASGFYEEYFSEAQSPMRKTDIIREVFSREDGRTQISQFLNIVFMQLDEQQFFRLIDEILSDITLSDEDIYHRLHADIDKASPGTVQQILMTFRSLKALKEDLSSQVETLMKNEKVSGYVEIGYPGRLVRPLKEKINLEGPVYVVNDAESLSDYLQSGYPRPYDKFVSLNDYDPIRTGDIPSGSVDLVSCYIGLHHIPVEKLEPFIRSIKRVLRPGGTFILMDHDAYSEEMKDMVSVVHTIFNAGTGVSPEDEAAEYRNFQSLTYWTNLLEKEGFKRSGHPPLIRNGDPTLNSLIKFTKEPSEVSEFTDTVRKSPDYFRPGLQTYLTAPEWQNVRVSQSYGEFIEHTPFYDFPYFSELANFWGVFAKSWTAARRDYSFWEVASSEYTMMNLFIGVMMTAEYSLKGLVSLPFSWLYGSEEFKEASTIQLLARMPDEESLDPRVKVMGKFPSENLYHLEIPRYLPFKEILISLADAGAEFSEIAGQSNIQIDLFVPSEKTIDLPEGCILLYTTPAPADPDHAYLACDIEVNKLGQVLRELRKKQVEIVLIHDY